MKIIINATNIRLGGSVQVTLSILEEFKRHDKNEYHVFLSPYLAKLVSTNTFPANFTFYGFYSYPLSSVKNILFFSNRLSSLEKQIQPDFVFSVFGPSLWRPKAPHLSGFANVILFDESPYTKRILLRSPLGKIRYKLRRYLTLKQLKKEADIFWLETEMARDKLAGSIKVSRDKIWMISNNYAAYFANAVKPVEKDSTYRFLYLSSYYDHKNFELLNRIIPLLKEKDINCRFYLTLKAEDFEKVFSGNTDSAFLYNVGPVKPEDCPALYNKVDAAFFPSFLEFFSAAYPEAMVMQKPILTSDLDFAHDICMDAALYFDPFDPKAAVDAIEQIISDAALQQNLIDKGLKRLQDFDSAAERAEKLLNIMKDYLDNNS